MSDLRNHILLKCHYALQGWKGHLNHTGLTLPVDPRRLYAHGVSQLHGVHAATIHVYEDTLYRDPNLRMQVEVLADLGRCEIVQHFEWEHCTGCSTLAQVAEIHRLAGGRR